MDAAERAELERKLAAAKATVASLELILNPECPKCGSRQRWPDGSCFGCEGAAVPPGGWRGEGQVA